MVYPDGDAMTDKSALVLVQDILKVGTVNEKDIKVNTLKVGKDNGVGSVISRRLLCVLFVVSVHTCEVR